MSVHKSGAYINSKACISLINLGMSFFAFYQRFGDLQNHEM